MTLTSTTHENLTGMPHGVLTSSPLPPPPPPPSSYITLITLCENSLLPGGFRAACCDLLRLLYIDRYPQLRDCGRPGLPELLWVYEVVRKDVDIRGMPVLRHLSLDDDSALPQFKITSSHPLCSDEGMSCCVRKQPPPPQKPPWCTTSYHPITPATPPHQHRIATTPFHHLTPLNPPHLLSHLRPFDELPNGHQVLPRSPARG